MGKLNISIGTIVDEKVSETNYEYWKVCLRSYLIGKGLWSVVSGKEAKPEDRGSEAYESWKRRKAKALHAIQVSCGSDVYDTVTKKNISATKAWTQIARRLIQPSQSSTLGDEGGQNERTDPGANCDFSFYTELWDAVDGGDWKKVQAFLKHNPHAINARISGKDDTALHVAIEAGHAGIAEALVENMAPPDLELRNKFGWSPLSLAAASGHINLAKAIVKKNAKTATIGSGEEGNFIPIIYASLYGHGEMTRYLYSQTPLEILGPESGISGPLFLNTLINPEIYDVALDLIQHYPRLGIIEDYYGNYGIKLLARKPSAFLSGCKFAFWERWIYSCIHISHLYPAKHKEDSFQGLMDEEGGRRPQKSSMNGVSIISQVPGVSGLVWNLIKCFVPGVQHVYNRKLMHERALAFLRCILNELQHLNESELEEIDITQTMCDAVEFGIVEYVIEMMKARPEIIWREDVKGRSVFSNAIVERQEKIFCLIYGLGTKKLVLARRHDMFANNFLHLAAKLSPPSRLDQASGAAMQMQRELHWFKEVEELVQPKYKEEVNDHNKTPSALFSEEHEALMKEGESWMKSTAASCMVVATLIAALMFTTTFTPPGGTNNTGVPIFLGHEMFMVFIIANALSLFSSSTSMLMFLGVLTSRYAEEDFLKELPTKLGIGLFSLFFSVASMMGAFGAALFIILHERLSWVSIPIAFFVFIPIALFVLLEFPLLAMMCRNTYGHGIFHRSTKRPY